MAITEAKNRVELDTSKVEFICPVCKSKKLLDVPTNVITEAKQLTTMSIARGLVCDHQFQAFVDKQYQVRGYQRVDFEFANSIKQEKTPKSKKIAKKERELFENLILEGNYLEYRPKKSRNKNKNLDLENVAQVQPKIKKINLKDIYDEFWDFIDDDNTQFSAFIKNDARRTSNLSTN
jgi:hypothetical protein